MGQSYFIWNGIDCRSKGVIMSGPPPIIRPEERVKHSEIPGRAGDLTETEGENIFNSYIQTVSINVLGDYNVRNIYKWLKGSGYVTFSSEPDRKQPARVIGAITLNRLSHNMNIWAGEVQFYCQPFKESLHPVATTISTSGTVINLGDVKSYPVIKATASTSSMTVSAGGNALVITGLADSTEYVIDSDTMMITNTAGTADYTLNSSGNFPVLNVGSNTVGGSGWSKLVIDRKERFL